MCIAAADFEQSRPDRAPQRDLAIMTADILDQQAVQIDGCGGARIEPALDPRRPPPSAPVRAPTTAPEFDQIGIFLRETRPIPGLLRRDRIHAPLHLLDLAPQDRRDTRL